MARKPSSYVALLRGINVGGKSKVDMATLRETVAEVGCDDVTTYINSGNVLFRDARAARTLRPRIERAIEDRFGFPVAVQLRDLAQIRRLNEAIPDDWTNDKEQKTDVWFVPPDLDKPGLLDTIAHRPEVETVLHAPGAIVWNISRRNQGRGSANRLTQTPLYKRVTIRNVNTVRKLRELLEEL
ncbi:MAG TPA: DUF1697 domain-containing protein [Thermoleophilaceae bacterium]|nr:DUF1697 domain-containing protein [Thermoleophilaceae bacterium]